MEERGPMVLRICLQEALLSSSHHDGGNGDKTTFLMMMGFTVQNGKRGGGWDVGCGMM